MDYVKWCHQVLDTIVEMTRESEEVRFVGFKRHDVAARLFGSATATRPAFADSDIGIAVRQALYSLSELNRIGIPNPLGGDMDNPTFVVSSLGERGSSWLRDAWGVLEFRPTSKEAVQVLVTIAPLSEQSRSDFAFLEIVPYSTLREALDWSELKFSAYFPLVGGHGGRDIGSRTLSYIYGGTTRATPPERGVRVSYAGLVAFHYFDEVIQLEQAAHARQSGELHPVPDRSLDLSFMTDNGLKAELEKDYQEALLSSTAGAYKAASIMLVGILEGMLLDAFQQPPLASDPRLIDARSKLTKKAPMSGNFNWAKVSLGGFTDLAEACELLDEARAKLVRGATTFRDNVHPAAQLRTNIRPSNHDIELFISALDVVSEHIRSRLA